jgi:hypothetical protein
LAPEQERISRTPPEALASLPNLSRYRRPFKPASPDVERERNASIEAVLPHSAPDGSSNGSFVLEKIFAQHFMNKGKRLRVRWSSPSPSIVCVHRTNVQEMPDTERGMTGRIVVRVAPDSLLGYQEVSALLAQPLRCRHSTPSDSGRYSVLIAPDIAEAPTWREPEPLRRVYL